MVYKIARAIVKYQGKYVLVQRAFHDMGGGLWQFPGGNTDGQHPAIAAKREVLEETGLVITELLLYKKVINPKTKNFSTYYKAKTRNFNPRLQKSEIANIGLFTLDEAKTLPITLTTAIVLSGMKR